MKLWEEIEAARNKIRRAILRTPMIYSDTFSKLTGKEVFLKLENLQKTGSFKIRGAYYKLSQFTPSMKKRGGGCLCRKPCPGGCTCFLHPGNPFNHCHA